MKKILLSILLISIFIITGCATSQPSIVSQKTADSNFVQPAEIEPSTPDLSQFSEDQKDVQGNIYAVQFYDAAGKEVSFSSRTSGSGTEYPIRKLVQINPTTGTTTVLISNLTVSARKVLSSVRDSYSFFVFSVTSDGYNIFLSEDRGLDGFNVPRPLWRFNTQTNELVFLKNVSSYTGSPFYIKLSPAKQMLVSAPDNDSSDNTCFGDSRHLFLLNMIKDTVELVVSLPKGQTLNAAYCGYMGGGFSIEWLNNTRIKYTIFDQSKADKNYENTTTPQGKPAVTSKIITF